MKANTDGPSLCARATALVVATVLLAHFAATFISVAPEDVLSNTVESTAAQYMSPLFDQSWSLYAPTPRFVKRNGSPQLIIRARLEDPRTKQLSTTSWLNVSSHEQSQKHDNPFAPRTTWLTEELVFRMMNARDALSRNQLSLTRGDYSNAGWRELRADLNRQAGASTDDIADYVQKERVVAALATQYARARWGPSVRAVQVRCVFRMIPRFEDQSAGPTTKSDELGWRSTLTFVGQSERLFADYAKRVVL